MMDSYNKATRKGLEGDRIAICPQFGCETIERVKPLKFGFLGFHKFPKCAVHKIPLVFVDEFIGDFLRAVNACLFDISGKPPKDLIYIFKKQAPKYLTSFINRWMYCSLLGRGAEMVPRYMDSLSTAYIKTLSKRQQKSIREKSYTKKKYKMLYLGLKKVEKEYIEFLHNFREKSEKLYDEKEIEPFPEEVRKLIQNWLKEKLENVKKQISRSESTEQNKSLSFKKDNYDKILQAGTCTLLLGKSPTILTSTVSAYELFSGYHEFLEARLCRDITSMGDLLGNLQKELDFNNKNINIHQQYSPYALDNLNDNKKAFPNKLFSIKTPEINIKDFDIKTRGWNYFRDLIYDMHDDNPPDVFKAFLKYSKEYFIEEYIRKIVPSIMGTPLKTEKIQTSFGKDLKLRKDYFTKLDPKFRQIFEQRLRYGFRWIIYQLKSKIRPYENKVYIGYSKNDVEYRFKQHIIAAISPHGHCQNCDYVNVVKLHKVIRKALEIEGVDWNKEWDWLEERVGLQDYKRRVNYLFNLVLKYIEIDTLELHHNFRMTKEREKYYTLNYKNEDGSTGTVANGLNQIAGGGGGVSSSLPVIDIFAMVTLGKNVKDIYDIVTELYHTNIAYSTFSEHIREIWESFSNLLEEALKPIVEKLIKDEQDYIIFEVSNVLNMNRTTLTKYLKLWYNGRGFRSLKRMVEEGDTEWENLEYLNRYELYKEGIERLSNVPLWLLKKWLVEGKSTIKIADEFGIFRKTVSKFIHQHPQLGNNLLTIQELRDKLRKDTIIQLLRKGWNPYEVVKNVFKMNNEKTRRLFKQLFPNKSFEEILEGYSGTEKVFSRIFHKQLGVNQKKVLELLKERGSLFLKDIYRNLNELTEDMVWSAVKGLHRRELVKASSEFNPKANRETNKYFITDDGKKILRDHWIKPKLG